MSKYSNLFYISESNYLFHMNWKDFVSPSHCDLISVLRPEYDCTCPVHFHIAANDTGYFKIISCRDSSSRITTVQSTSGITPINR